MKEGAVLIIRDSQDRILLAKRGSNCKGYSAHWEFPGETRESFDRNLRETASRGSWEELGLCVRPHEWVLIGSYESDRWDNAPIYEICIGNRNPVISEPGLCEELQFIPLNEIYRLDPLTPETLLILEVLYEEKERRTVYENSARVA